MNKIIMGIFIAVILLLGVTTSYFKCMYDRTISPPEEKMVIMSNELKGVGKLILAEQKVYLENTRKYHKAFSNATVLFRWIATLQYLIDLENPAFTISRSGSAIRVSCPPIQLNEPSIDVTTYRPGIILDSGIFISELSRINEEMRTFREQSRIKGMELMTSPQVVTLCTEKVKLIVYKVAAGMQMQVGDVEVTFGEKQP